MKGLSNFVIVHVVGNLLDEKIFEFGSAEILYVFVGDYPAFMDDGEMVANGFDVGEDVGIEKHRRAPGFEFEDEVFDHFPAQGVETAHGFV